MAVKQSKFAQGAAFLLLSGALLIEISALLIEHILRKGGLKKGNCWIKHSNFSGALESQCKVMVHWLSAMYAALGFVLILAGLCCICTYIMPKMPASCATFAM